MKLVNIFLPCTIGFFFVFNPTHSNYKELRQGVCVKNTLACHTVAIPPTSTPRWQQSWQPQPNGRTLPPRRWERLTDHIGRLELMKILRQQQRERQGYHPYAYQGWGKGKGGKGGKGGQGGKGWSGQGTFSVNDLSSDEIEEALAFLNNRW